uniref:56 kDa type-specific antigen n=1 Tax=Orientia tsutsugamushi TaxID=784 RepID=I6T4M8_ORITS|nr:56 kDa type-specific antigen [Orientia tsutsugamushi]
MKKIMLIASAMSALSLPFSASAIELGDEGVLECGPYAKIGVVGGMVTGVESARLDPADVDCKKHLSLTTMLPFGGTLAAGMTIAPGFRAELGVMYLRNINAEVELGEGKTGSGAANAAIDTGAPIRKRFKLTPPQPTIMPISIADRDLGVDTDILAQAAVGQQQLTVEQRAEDRIAWLKNYAGIDYMVPDSQNPNARVVNPVLLNITQGAPNVNPRPRQNLDILDHDQWRYLVVGVTALSNANKLSVSSVKVLSDKITQIYSDIRQFAKIVNIEVPGAPLPNSASVEQIQTKMQELNDVLEELRESFDGYLANAFANQIQLNFQIQQAQQQQQQQQQGQVTAQEAAAAAAVRALNGNEQIIQLYKDLVKLQRHAGIRKAMEKLAAQEEGDDQSQVSCNDKKQQAVAEDSKAGSSKEGKNKEVELDLSMIVAQVKLYADVVATESFSIYIGGGVGVARTYGDIDGKSVKHIGVVASGVLGVAINVADGVCVDIDGGYMHSFSKIEDKYSVNAFIANAGVRYNF